MDVASRPNASLGVAMSERLSSPDLLPGILSCLPATSVVHFACTSKEICKTSCCEPCLVAMGQLLNSQDPAVQAMLPKDQWCLERLHLCQNPPRFPSISFAFASDDISINAHHALEKAAQVLEKHPRLRRREENLRN